MRIILLITAATALLVSCGKGKTCTARDKFGNELGVTEGSDQCEKNINKANGEWCDCED
ncbi:MAG: hypothetical protein MUE96_04045 [Bacteroidia bacterium]|nr:hypothetical protein [Bacteroidia bacterium]